jgi:hypothetical protein
MHIEPYLSYTRILYQEKSSRKFLCLLSFINQSYKMSSKLTVSVVIKGTVASDVFLPIRLVNFMSIGVFFTYDKIFLARSPKIRCFLFSVQA